MPITRLLDEGFAVTAWYMNPNIHPLSEYLRRRDAAGECAERLGIPIPVSYTHLPRMMTMHTSTWPAFSVCWANLMKPQPM